MIEQTLPLDGPVTRPPPRVPPTPNEQRQLLVNAGRAYNELHPPGPGEPQTAEEQVDEALAKGVVRLRTQEELVFEHEERERIAAEAQEAVTGMLDVGGGGSANRFARRDMVLCPAQDQIEVEFDEHGDLTMTQRSSMGESEDQTIHVAQGNIGRFIDLLTDALGIPSFP